MYMVYSYLLTKDFRLSEETVLAYPEKCRWYHLDRAKTLFAQDKFIVLDEFHRPVKTKSKKIVKLVDRYNREGRKWGLSVILSTQDIDDLDPVFIRSFSTSLFLTGTPEFAKKIKATVGLGDAEYKALVQYCRGPTAKGAPFLAFCTTKDEGISSQILYSTISPIEIWALSTTKEDVVIREKVTEELGIVEARARLGRAYPFTAKSEVEALNAANNKLNPNPENLNPIDFIVRKIVNSPAIYSNNLGAVNDAENEVKRYVRQKELENAKKYQSSMNREIDLRKKEQQEKEFDKILDDVKKQKESESQRKLDEIEQFDGSELVEEPKE